MRTEAGARQSTENQEWVARRWKLVTFSALAIAAVAIAVVLALGEERVAGTSADDRVTPVPTVTPTPQPTATPTPTAVVLPPSPHWSAGMAAVFSCNMFASPGFEQDPLPDNWYQDDPANSITLISGAGVDYSTALRIGAGPEYGLFAERVAVTGGEPYHFSAWVRRQGEPSQVGMWLEFETAAFEQIAAVEQTLFGPYDGLQNREARRITTIFDVPADAAWALPTFFKDASAGSMLVDEVVFGPASACGDVPT